MVCFCKFRIATKGSCMKKIFSILLSLFLIADLVTGCSQNSFEKNLPTLTLALREGIYADVIKECVKGFEEREKVHCEIIELSEEELHSNVAATAENKSGQYDLCMVDGSWMAEYTEHGVLANLSSLGYRIDQDIIPATTKVCYYGDDVYLAPYYGNVTVLLYNKLIIERTGHSTKDMKNMKDVLQICKDATKKGHLGFMYRGDTTNNVVVDFLPVLSSFGGWVVDEDNHPTVNTPEFQRALAFYLELIGTGKAEPRDNLVVAIANNAAAMAVGWPGWYTPAEKSTADYQAFAGKAEKGSKSYNANVYGIWTLGIPEYSKQKELSEKLLEYLMDKEIQKETVSYGGVPCRYSSLQDTKILEVFPQYEAVCNALENGIYRPIMAEWPEFYEILGTKMLQIIQGEKNVSEGLGEAQEELEEKLEHVG